jgi:hypothetical protein
MKASTVAYLLPCIVLLGGGFLCVWNDIRKPPVPYRPSNWKQLRIGMSEDEVFRLLGNPTNKGPNCQMEVDRPCRSGTLCEEIWDRLILVWFIGFEGCCESGLIKGSWWEYYGGPGVSGRPILLQGSFKEAFVVYFLKKKVVGFRRPLVGPFADESADQ